MPQIKEETLNIDSGRRPVEMMGRKGPAVFARDDSGARVEHPVKLLDSETALAILGSSGRYPEIGDLRATVLGWRFYQGFRTDRDSPVRQPSLAITAPLLDEDGRNLAAVFATLVHIPRIPSISAAVLPMRWAAPRCRCQCRVRRRH